MKFKFTWGKKLVAGVLMTAVVLGSTITPTQAATKSASDKGATAVVQADNYRRTLCKGFLGKSYGAVIDGIRCDCSGYTRAALNRMKSNGGRGDALKDVQVNARCTRDWVKGSSISYTMGTATDDEDSVLWDDRSSFSIGKKSTGVSRVSDLELGDVVVYGKGGTSSHIAIYFGQFSSIDEVKEYLEDLGLYNLGSLKKAGNKYQYNGRTIVRKYGSSNYWRIHSTCSGIMIDNDIAGTSGYTSSFGKWQWTFDTGIQAN